MKLIAPMPKRVLQLDTRDNVLIALADLRQGESIAFAGKQYLLVSDIPAKHKFAMEDLAMGGEIMMYGVLVGKSVKPIPRGDRLTTGNVQHDASTLHEQTGEYRWQAPDTSKWWQRTFLGYHRADGQVVTRNYWLVVALVFCENRNIGVLMLAFDEELGFAAPQVYRQQVADLARLCREGKTEEIATRAAFAPGAEYSTEPGLNLQCTPGNDMECVTAQVGARARVVLFTTGLGTPTGNPSAPVIKLSTNSTLAERMSDNIDLDTGPIISGKSTIEQMGENILDFVIQVASGQVHSKAEFKGQTDFIPWKRGVSL